MQQCGLVDSHLHLQDFEPGTDIGAVIEQAAAAGVTQLICNGAREADWPKVQSFAKSYPEVVPCFGVHPWFVTSASADWLSALDMLVKSTACGVGEIGLDRNRQPFDKAALEEAFRLQLDIARRYDCPAMIHCVRSWGWMMDVLRSENPLQHGFLMHAYGGSADLVAELVEMGAYISFSGKALEPNYARARKALQAVPPGRLLIETDAPCMVPPEEFRAYRMTASDGEEMNHPANLPLILRGIAGLLGQPADELRAQLWENARRFFGPILKDTHDG